MMRIYKGSGAKITYTVEDVPSGVTVTGARFAIKKTLADPDSAGVLVAPSSVSQSGTTATIVFDVTPSSIASLQQGTHVCGVKVQLSDGSKAVLDESIEDAEILGEFIEW
jgi:hypothetical protein